jgi:ribosomal protein L32E
MTQWRKSPARWREPRGEFNDLRRSIGGGRRAPKIFYWLSFH